MQINSLSKTLKICHKFESGSGFWQKKLFVCNTALWILKLCVIESWSQIFFYFFNWLPYNLGKRWKPWKYVLYVVQWCGYSSRKQFNSEHEYVTYFVIGLKQIMTLLSFVTRPNPCAQLVPPITELATTNRKVWLWENNQKRVRLVASALLA